MGAGNYSDDDDIVMDTYANLRDGKKVKIDKLDDNIFVGIIIRFIKDKVYLPKELIKSAIEANDNLTTDNYKSPKQRSYAIKDQKKMLQNAYKKQVLLHELLI